MDFTAATSSKQSPMKRTLGIILFSVIEVAGLAGWLILADLGRAFTGILVLLVGLVVEHIVTDNLLHKRALFQFDSLPFGQILAFSTLETGIWVSWLALWGVHPALASAFLVAALVIEHTISKNVHERRPIFDKIVDVGVLPHTIVETAACDGWLVLVRTAQPIYGVVFLLLGSILEHFIAVSRTKT